MELKVISLYFDSIGEKENKKLKMFYILDSKKSERKIIFQKGQRDAIQFMKNKFDSSFKKILYFLIKINFLQIFLNRTRLDSSVGQLVFFGGQTKIFDFRKRQVFSFPRNPGRREDFIKNKEEQIKLSKKGFAPEISFLDKKIPYSVEELLDESICISNKKIFKKLFKYYGTQKIRKILYSSYIEKLEKKNSFMNLPEDLKDSLKRMKEKKKYFYTINVHGDFRKEQILLKNKEVLFTDWEIREDLILADLFNFFRDNKDNKEFFNILRMFSENVKENVKDYFVINQIRKWESKRK